MRLYLAADGHDGRLRHVHPLNAPPPGLLPSAHTTCDLCGHYGTEADPVTFHQDRRGKYAFVCRDLGACFRRRFAPSIEVH